MATIVCQGLQSCLESPVLEPRTIRLELSCFVDEKRSHYDDEKQISSTNADDSHCWSFPQAISNNGSKLESTDKETTIYVHHLNTRSKSTLSDKSLELCTENLGSETGTDIIEDSSIRGIFSSPSETGGNVIPPRREHQKRAIKKDIARNFPPPLTTICGVASLQVRPHREDGRLVIKATKAPSPHCSLFQAERSHGRLLLSLFKDSDEEEIENDMAAASCGEEEEEIEEEEEEGDVVEDDFDEENEGYMEEEDEGVNKNNRDVGGQIGIKKFQGPGRCKEGQPEKKGMINWEAFWVATS